MQPKVLRVIHYINQFFGGVGGEDKADVGPKIINGPVGPGKAVQNALGNQGAVVATVICGDNYFAEKTREATDQVIQMIRLNRPDVVIAGPAFNAGRYGIACGTVCKAAQDQLGIAVVAGMYEENPGLELFRKDLYIVQTGASARGIDKAISKMVKIALKLAAKQKIGKPSEEGYFPRGFVANEMAGQTGAERVVAMLLKKLQRQHFESEVTLPQYERVDPAPRLRDVRAATIALVTDGGLVPKGNPDRIEARGATRFGSYSIRGINALSPQDYEVNHGGYDSIFVRQDPNRLVPVDVARDLEKEGAIGKLYEKFYSTAGVATVVENVKKMGRAIAEELKAKEVSGVILTST